MLSPDFKHRELLEKKLVVVPPHHRNGNWVSGYTYERKDGAGEQLHMPFSRAEKKRLNLQRRKTIGYRLGQPSDTAGRHQQAKSMEQAVREVYDSDVWNPEDSKPSYEDFKAEVVDRLRGVLQALGGDPVIRVPPRVLPYILEDGRLKSQFETDRSGGYFAPDIRKGMEDGTMGVPGALPSKYRPIYGVIEDESGFLPSGTHYGEVALVLKSSMKKRVTVCAGDSLDHGLYPVPYEGVEQADEEAILAACAMKWVCDSAWMVRADFEGSWEPEASTFDGDEYIEIQVHGGVTVDDIEAVHFGELGWSIVERYGGDPSVTTELARSFAERIGAEFY